MTLHWTIISNELTQKYFCPIGVRRNLFESSSVWSYRTATPYMQEAQTFVKMADICCYGVRYGKCEWGVSGIFYVVCQFIDIKVILHSNYRAT